MSIKQELQERIKNIEKLDFDVNPVLEEYLAFVEKVEKEISFYEREMKERFSSYPYNSKEHRLKHIGELKQRIFGDEK